MGPDRNKELEFKIGGKGNKYPGGTNGRNN